MNTTLTAPTGQKIKLGQHWRRYGRGTPRKIIDIDETLGLVSFDGAGPKVIEVSKFTGKRNGWELCEGAGTNGNGSKKPEGELIASTPQNRLAGILERRCRYTPVGVEFPEPEQLTFPEWEEIFNFHYVQAERSHWVLGDTLVQGMRNFVEWTQVVPENRLQKKTLMNIANVAERYTMAQRKHIFDLSWSHYREVVYLDPDKREHLLETAAKEGWTVKQIAEAKVNFTKQEPPKPARKPSHVGKEDAQPELPKPGDANASETDSAGENSPAAVESGVAAGETASAFGKQQSTSICTRERIAAMLEATAAEIRSGAFGENGTGHNAADQSVETAIKEQIIDILTDLEVRE